MSLARTYWGIPSSFFEIGVQYGPPACGRRSVLDSNFSEFRRYSPIRPRQTHGITSVHVKGCIVGTSPKYTEHLCPYDVCSIYRQIFMRSNDFTKFIFTFLTFFFSFNHFSLKVFTTKIFFATVIKVQ